MIDRQGKGKASGGDDMISPDELRLAFSGVPNKDPSAVKDFLYLFNLSPEGQITKAEFIRVVKQLSVLMHEPE